MAPRISETRHEDSYLRVRKDFHHIEAEKIKRLYSSIRAALEREAVIHDFIPILAEKTLRDYLHKTEH